MLRTLFECPQNADFVCVCVCVRARWRSSSSRCSQSPVNGTLTLRTFVAPSRES